MGLDGKRGAAWYSCILWLFLLYVPFSITKLQAAEQGTAQLVQLTTLEWPPYTGATLQGQGESSVLLRRVLQQMGYRLQIQILPWLDAMAAVQEQPSRFLGFFPEYPLQDPRFIQTSAIGYSEVGLVEPIQAPLLLMHMEQLSAYKLGVVTGYLNMSALDQLIEEGRIKPTYQKSDVENILQVATGQLDAAVIDKRVLHYLLEHEPALAGVAHKVQFSKSLAEHRSLHLVLLNTAANSRFVSHFNQTLAQLRMQYTHNPSN